jgi:hypothetical protein
MKERTKDLIKELHECVNYNRSLEIEKEFPELFKEDALVVGKWYKTNGLLQKFLGKFGNDSTYGFRRNGVYSASMGFHNDDTHDLATDKEVEEALIKEAKKIGFKEGVCFIPANGIKVVKMASEDRWGFTSEGKLLFCNYSVFENGFWAIIIKQTITKEQAEKELGKTILN